MQYYKKDFNKKQAISNIKNEIQSLSQEILIHRLNEAF